MIIQEDIPLADLTTFKIGGPARYFVSVRTAEELREAADFARGRNLPLFILGGGSNILISDQGFPGLVVKIEIKGIEITDKKSDGRNMVQIRAGAGENWDDLVAFAVGHGAGGIENLSLIPGTVGAAPVQNIGAYGAEIKETISSVEVFNLETSKIENLGNADCQFSYRDSIFKKPEGKKYIITRVVLRLADLSNLFSKNKSEKNGSGNSDYKLKTDYKDIQEHIKDHDIAAADLTITKIRDIVVAIRTAKLPDVKKIGTAGSFFKNPIVAESKFQELEKHYSDLPSFPVENQTNNTSADSKVPDSGASSGQKTVKIPAAWLLDKICGFKGYRQGSAGVYQNQALVLVNFGGASSANILNLAQKMTDCVREKTGIELEREVQIVE